MSWSTALVMPKEAHVALPATLHPFPPGVIHKPKRRDPNDQEHDHVNASIPEKEPIGHARSEEADPAGQKEHDGRKGQGTEPETKTGSGYFLARGAILHLCAATPAGGQAGAHLGPAMRAFHQGIHNVRSTQPTP